jgi:hypothetical protein
MTASRRTGGTGGWDDLACRIWLPDEARPPRLHLLDLDNLHVGTTPDLEDIDRIRDLYEPFLGADDLGCVAANHAPRLVPGASSIRSFRIRRRWRPFTVRLAQGADGADLWRPVLATEPAGRWTGRRWAFLEYVPDDDPACLASEADTLRAWIEEAGDA